ncbi:HIT domain-containing protein [soil metagenome]
MSAGDLLQRLWAPHRMAYVTGDDASSPEQDDQCPFCRIPAGDDAESLVVARGELTYAVLNLHPYNPGHLMMVPFRHVAEYEDLTTAEAADVALLTQQALRTVRTVSAPHGFNVGLNLGGVAGGSVADHLHQHVVPRWSGDANFITVVGETKLLPQLLADTRDLLANAWQS